MANKEETLLTTVELAERWRVHRGTLDRWRMESKGPKYVKIGEDKFSKILYRLSDVVAYEKKYLVKTTA